MRTSPLNTRILASLARPKVASANTSIVVLLMVATPIHAQQATPVPDIDVTAPSPQTVPISAGQKPTTSSSGSVPTGAAPAAATPSQSAPEGSEAAGYKPQTTTNFGPFGSLPILDVPYSVNVISSDLIQNTLSSRSDDVFQISPVVQTYFPTGASHGAGLGYNLRGFQQSAIAEDGLRTNSFYPMSLEDKERVEIYTGLTGFLFGPTNVGGLVNYVYKKPTSEPLANVTVGNYGGQQGFVHGDFGGAIDKEGRFAYRLNIVEQHGDTAIDNQSLDRQLVTAALDWHITSDTKLSVMGTYENYDMHDLSTYWNYAAINNASPFNYKWVPDPTKNYSPTYSSLPYTVGRAESALTSKINDIFTARVGFSFTSVYFGSYFGNLNYLTTSSDIGKYNQNIWLNLGTLYQTTSGYGFLDAKFDTFGVEHNITAGYYGNHIGTYYGAGTANPVISTSNISLYYAPAYAYYYISPNVSPPNTILSYYGTPYLGAIAAQNNIVLGDEVKFNRYFSALIGANYADMIAKNYNSTPPFAISSQYDSSRVTPSFSLIFKPAPWVSTYGTYSQSLEQGQIVPSSAAYTNSGQVLPPFADQEYELGAKANIHGMLLTAALFDITKVNQYAQANPNGTSTYVQNGRQHNRGVELTATGNVAEGLRLIGGVTLLDALVQQASTPILNDKAPMNVAGRMVKATAEYDLPYIPSLSFLQGLTLTGGVYYVGPQAADPLNSVWISGYTTENLGFRYKNKLPTGQEIICRLNVSNITNQGYWASTYATGAPRTVAAAVEIKF